MGLSTDIVSQFVKATNDSRKTKVDTSLFGTTVAYGSSIYVKLDGSDVLTPISTTTDVHEGERVMVTIKNHAAIITGNISSPSVNLQTNLDNGDGTTVKLSDLGISIKNGILRVDKLEANSLTADSAVIKELQTNKLSADSAVIKELQANSLTAESAIIKDLQANKLSADSAVIKDLQANSLTAESAIIKNLQTDKLEADSAVIKDLQTNSLTAESAIIKSLQTDKLDAETANITYATIKSLEAVDLKVTNLSATHGNFETLTTKNFTAVNASISKLDTDKLNVTAADIKYATIESLNTTNANIDSLTTKVFSADQGFIKEVIMESGYVTRELVGVTIQGDLIQANTIEADKLVVKGPDGLYYRLNVTEGGITPSEQITEDHLKNGLHGSNIIAKTITVDKIKVTDLVAFGATIAKFKIGDEAIYSGSKTSANDGTEGIYLGSDGQIAFGDGLNYLKYFVDTDDEHKLRIGFGKDGVANIIEGTTNGLFLGNQAGNNIIIDTNSVDICDGTDVLARYGANKVELGCTSRTAKIELCGGMAQISNIASSGSGYNRLKIGAVDPSSDDEKTQLDTVDIEACAEINLHASDYRSVLGATDEELANGIAAAHFNLHTNAPWYSDNQVTSIIDLHGETMKISTIGGYDVTKCAVGDLTMNAFSTVLQHIHLQAYNDADGNTVGYNKTASITMYGCLGDTNSSGSALTDIESWYNKIDIEADKTAISGDLSVDGACTIGKWNARTSLVAYADTTIHGDCDIINGNIVISGSRDDEDNLVGGSIEANGNLVFSGTKTIVEKTTSDGLLTYTEEALCPSAIYGKKYYVNADGKLVSRGSVEILVPQDENGDLLIGRGVSSTLSTTDCTRIYGYDVYL
jgi:hypothetical protein